MWLFANNVENLPVSSSLKTGPVDLALDWFCCCEWLCECWRRPWFRWWLETCFCQTWHCDAFKLNKCNVKASVTAAVALVRPYCSMTSGNRPVSPTVTRLPATKEQVIGLAHASWQKRGSEHRKTPSPPHAVHQRLSAPVPTDWPSVAVVMRGTAAGEDTTMTMKTTLLGLNALCKYRHCIYRVG